MDPPTPRLVLCPSIYVQGPDAIRHTGRYASIYGNRAFIVGDEVALPAVKDVLTSSLSEKQIEVAGVQPGIRMCTTSTVQKFYDSAKGAEPNIIVAVGGGSAVDVGKIVAHNLKVPVCTIATIAATAAYSTSLVVQYNDDGFLEDYVQLGKCPEIVIVDSKIIAEAPVEFLLAGMGDALGCWFEQQAHNRTVPHSDGGYITVAAELLGKGSFHELRTYGLAAKIANEHKIVVPALERVIEVNVLDTAIGYLSGGNAAAHSIHNGFVSSGAVSLDRRRKPYSPHGQIIAFTLLAQLILENKPLNEIEDIIDFSQSLGLATTMEDVVGKDIDDHVLRKASEIACDPHESIHAMTVLISPERVFNAVKEADALAHHVKSRSVS